MQGLLFLAGGTEFKRTLGFSCSFTFTRYRAPTDWVGIMDKGGGKRLGWVRRQLLTLVLSKNQFTCPICSRTELEVLPTEIAISGRFDPEYVKMPLTAVSPHAFFLLQVYASATCLLQPWHICSPAARWSSQNLPFSYPWCRWNCNDYFTYLDTGFFMSNMNIFA